MSCDERFQQWHCHSVLFCSVLFGSQSCNQRLKDVNAIIRTTTTNNYYYLVKKIFVLRSYKASSTFWLYEIEPSFRKHSFKKNIFEDLAESHQADPLEQVVIILSSNAHSTFNKWLFHLSCCLQYDRRCWNHAECSLK